ncbi:MAG: hypothetical protein IJV35_05600 [Neisseriaceae bacterium]|nr:hypothetical protein [Neisseriaceae bacterium]
MSSEQLFSQACGLTDFLDVLSGCLKEKLVSLRDFAKQNRGNPVLPLGKT